MGHEKLRQRLAPHWGFPSYIFIPGKNPHPKKSGGHMEGEKDPVAPALDPRKPSENEFFRYALDLYNYGYLWESHVYFEALWNTHGRTGEVADFMKGMIKLGAAGIKRKLGQKVSAEGHFLRALEIFSGIKKTQGPSFLGFDLDLMESEIQEVLQHEETGFMVLPDWD